MRKMLVLMLLVSACTETADSGADVETLGAFNNPACVILCGTRVTTHDAKGNTGTYSPSSNDSGSLSSQKEN